MVPTLQESLAQLRGFPDDIRLIRQRTGLGLSGLGRSLGVSKVAVWRWQKGERVPREPLIMLSLLAWAKRLRNS